MKIDIHTHTIKIKQGDSEHRNIDVNTFTEIIKETDVKILATTNHNHFDHEQYLQFKINVDGICQIWPGVEFDIQEEERKAHLIVIVNPKNAEAFSQKVNEVIGSTTADNFTITINDLVEKFDNLDSIFIAHYHSKKPNLLDKDLDGLLELVTNPKRVLKEASNSIFAGIYINPGDPLHYKNGKPTSVTVRNINLCTGLSTSKTFSVYPPAPCASSAKLASKSKVPSSTKVEFSEILATTLIITPNPTNGTIKAMLPDNYSGYYQIFDINGVLLQEAKFDNQTELQIEMSQKLKSGIYILKVITETTIFTGKIILDK